MSNKPIFISRKPALLTKAMINVHHDLEEIVEKWSDLESEISPQDLGHLASLLMRMADQTDFILSKIKDRSRSRRLRLVGDRSAVIAVPYGKRPVKKR